MAQGADRKLTKCGDATGNANLGAGAGKRAAVTLPKRPASGLLICSVGEQQVPLRCTSRAVSARRDLSATGNERECSMSASINSRGTAAAGVSPKWGWFVALGIVLIALGVAAWLDLAAVTIASTIFIGASLFIGGAFQIIQAFMTKEWRGFVLRLFCGVLYLVGGLLIMNEPVQGALVLTLLVAAAFIVGGVVRIALAL